MEYFKLNDRQNFLDNVEKQYDTNNPGTIWFLDTRHKLQHLITLIEAKLNLSLINNYNEKPNGMAGQGKGFKLKHYVLSGFIEKKYFNKIDKKCFLKVQFYEQNGELFFSTDIDVNFSDGKNKFNNDRDNLQNSSSHSWKVDANFPKDWDTLINLIIPFVSKNISYLDNYITKQILPSMEKAVTENNKSSLQNNNSLNQILYGPPGTGKTYNSINKAISIINPEFDLTQDRSLIKKEYDRLVTENQILFTTFHQSMSYEDFIEGIKPETKEENVIYDVVPGLFLEICNTAENNWEDAKEGNSQKLSFEDAFLLLKEEWVENEEIKFPLKREGNDFTILGFTKKSIQFKKASGGTGHTLSIGTLKDYYYKKKEVRLTGVGIYYPSILDKLNKYQPTTISQKVIKNYVIIIDEINRGNVSQIFGELITLIEEDKRLGKDEALEVMLPYSKEKFGVPPNLYIVGTMNTADRSVEALDTALRRRFSFEEIQPNSRLIATEGKLKESQGIVDDINLPRVLETINNRIDILSNRDHKIGHSYFMKVTSLADLKATFKKNIIPLLQEYFYNDHEKIGWVLGEGFFVPQKADKKTIFTDFFKQQRPDFELNYQLADIDTIDIKKAMLQLLGDFKEEQKTQDIEN